MNIGGVFLQNNNTQILMFLCCASVAILTDLCAYFALLNFMPYSIAKGISYILASQVAYFTNKHFTFKRNTPNTGTFRRFLMLYTATFFINVLTNKLALFIIPKSTLVCFLIAAVITMACNFLGQKYFVFGGRKCCQ